MPTHRITIPFFLTAAVLISILAWSPSQALPPSQAPAHEVTVSLTVIDKTQNLSDIRAEDLKVRENGQVQRIAKFQKVTDAPVWLALVIDISISQERLLGAQKAAATSFINSVIRPNRDLVAVATFSNVVHLEQQITNDLDLIRAAISRVQLAEMPREPGPYVARPRGAPPPPGTTSIWDSLMQICDRSRISSLPTAQRSAIVLLTDGWDTTSVTKLQQVSECLSTRHIAVYSIGAGDNRLDGVNKRTLRKLSQMTGGLSYFPGKQADFSEEFDHIGKLLRNYYVLTYESSSTKALDQIHIEPTNKSSKQIELLYGQFLSR